ncbi:MAG TPA: 3-hydroxyacyl-CoA dehydrogenase NAD-binding domain-containing protein [Actinomycetota bacterium]|nr:3-hydroxyacyl-CoA dehydrogenase NAD-binding domain-containing protein [Actinomycetota bacterium]
MAVIGAGTMGHGIALVFARSGFRVRLQDVQPRALESARSRIELLLERAVARGTASPEQRQAALSRLHYVETLAEGAEGCALAVEAVTEDPDVKRSVFAELDRVAPPEAILATNTSALSITEIAGWTRRPGRVVGMHFFNPPDRMPLVEVVPGMTTEPETVERVRWYCDRIDKESIVVADRPGFATSRLSALIGNEAWYMFMEGVASPPDIDRAARLGLGHPMGPFELGDLIGLDVRLSVLRYLHATLGERFRPCPLLVKYVEAGYLGRKTGRGVYVYHEGGARDA